MPPNRIEQALSERESWLALIRDRQPQLTRFLGWAAACEDGAPETSVRLAHRRDIGRCRGVLHQFSERWWGAVVYSCFDSATGTSAAAEHVRQPPAPAEAHRLVSSIRLTKGAVGDHRTRRGHTGALRALGEACRRQDDLRYILLEMHGFHDRYQALRALGVPEWGRTTCFDLLVRAGMLGVGDASYRPDRAYLDESTGPKKGFKAVWGIEPVPGNFEACEELLRKWTRDWHVVASASKVGWAGEPYDSADFENALCIFQERPRKHLPNPAAFAES